MEIGSKLKLARQERQLTQEVMAAFLGVSRQTISNWENNKSYPDIISLIKISDYYDMTLDELVKGDPQMVNHLSESTNRVKSQKRFSKLIQVITYVLIWTFMIGLFWIGSDPGDAMGYALLTFYIILPVTSLIISFLIGKDQGWTRAKWLMTVFFGFMYMLADYVTFELGNMMAFDKFNLPDFKALLIGMILSAMGMGIGHLLRKKEV